MSDLAATLKSKTKTSTTTSFSKEEKKKEVPKGAEIISKTVRTETEEIENGWLISKNYDITYKEKTSEYNGYAYFSKKWYSKTDPLTIKLNDKALADAFETEDFNG